MNNACSADAGTEQCCAGLQCRRKKVNNEKVHSEKVEKVRVKV